MKKLVSFILIFFSISLTANSALAEQSQEIGNYTVHYIAVNSTFISSDIARDYNIVRGNRRAFINISVLKNSQDGSNSTTPVVANVSGGKKNLFGQASNIEFIKVTEGDAIYYLGQFEFSNAEDTRFEIEVQPEENGRSYTIEWTSKLYNN